MLGGALRAGQARPRGVMGGGDLDGGGEALLRDAGLRRGQGDLRLSDRDLGPRLVPADPGVVVDHRRQGIPGADRVRLLDQDLADDPGGESRAMHREGIRLHPPGGLHEHGAGRAGGGALSLQEDRPRQRDLDALGHQLDDGVAQCEGEGQQDPQGDQHPQPAAAGRVQLGLGP